MNAKANYMHVLLNAVGNAGGVTAEGYVPMPQSLESLKYWLDAIASEMIAHLHIIESLSLETTAFTAEAWPIQLKGQEMYRADKVAFSFRVGDSTLLTWEVTIGELGVAHG